MFGKWLQRKIELKAIKSVTEDIDRFLITLRGQTIEERALLVALATIIRVNIEDSRMVDREVFANWEFCPPLSRVEIPQKMNKIIQAFQSSGQLTDAAGAMVWLHTFRALCWPEVRLQGREVWRLLQEAFPHVQEQFEVIETMINKPIPARAWIIYDFVPPGLRPN